ncbi:MAG: S8 family serine peptidase [bacterium]
MRRSSRILLAGTAAALLALAAAPRGSSGGARQEPGTVVHPALLRAGGLQDSLTVWVFLSDRGPGASRLGRDVITARSGLSRRALERRARRGRISGPVISDLPPSEEYLRRLRGEGLQVRVMSRWLNAVSGRLAPDDLGRVAVLRSVDRIAPVARLRRPLPPETGPAPSLRRSALPARNEQVYDQAFYGASWEQNLSAQVPDLHQEGFTGSGIVVGVADTGFRTTHRAFERIVEEGRLLGTYDFVNGDSVVTDEAGQGSVAGHGTSVWSIVGAHWPQNLVGPAFESSFLLAKTEDQRDERQVEEDYFIAALEWMEGEGADVVNLSAGYYEWYAYRDMDGDTAPITVASDAAAARGVLVVTSAGNEGDRSPPTSDTELDYGYYVGAPADGDSVITVGAVDTAGQLASFSSRGPTYDGRIKPDVTARGVGVSRASASTDSSTATGSGTSYASPLAAGVAALLYQAHPDWGPMDVREALRQTADRSFNMPPGQPDNDYGWGRIRGEDARSYGRIPPEPVSGLTFFNYPNPFTSATVFSCGVPRSGEGSIRIFTLEGTLVRELDVSAPGPASVSVSWDGRNESARRVAPGVYLAVLEFEGLRESTRVMRIPQDLPVP